MSGHGAADTHGGAHATTGHGEDREENAHSDRRLSVAILVMLGSLAVLFALIVPAAIVLIHRAAGY